jgi:hypothetical protein
VATPEHLRQQAVLLLEHYASSTITSALRISGAQLKQWREVLLPANTDFVSLPLTNQLVKYGWDRLKNVRDLALPILPSY